MERTCLECGEKLRGRVDQKFCSDYCRNAYNNNKRRDVNNYMRQVNNKLRANRRLLEKIAPDGKGKANREYLLKNGFDFDFFTNRLVTKAGKVYYFCYDYGYLELDNDWFAIVRRNH